MTQSPLKIRILTVDDHPLLREGIASLINSQPDMEIIDEAESGHKAVELHRKHHPDVTLMDLRMNDMDGIEATTRILAETPQAKIIILTTYDGDVNILRALKAGAQGYLLKGSLRHELVDAIRSVRAGRKRMSPEAATQVANFAGDSTLTLREIEVLEQIAEGSSNKVVADKLSITEDTVKAHVRSILSKLGANDRTHAVTIAVRRGIINI